MHSLSRFLNLRRLGAAFAAAIGVAAGLVPIPLATAATVTLSGGTTSCTYSGSTVTSGGDFTFTCTGGSSPGVLALNLDRYRHEPRAERNDDLRRHADRPDGRQRCGYRQPGRNRHRWLHAQRALRVDLAMAAAIPRRATVTLTAGPTAGTSCTVTLTAGGASLGSPSTTIVSIVDPNAPVSFAFTSATSTAFFGGSSRADHGHAHGRHGRRVGCPLRHRRHP